MWIRLAHAIIKYRPIFLVLIAAITFFLGYKAQFAQMSYDFAAAVPEDDPELQYFRDFKKIFGEDGGILAVGMQDSSLYKQEKFIHYKAFGDSVASIKGISAVLALPQVQYLDKDTVNKRFLAKPVFSKMPATQAELDSILRFVRKFKFYDQQLINAKNGATIMLISIEKKVLNSENRQGVIDKIQAFGEQFSQKTAINLHYAGLPFARSIVTNRLAAELKLLLILSGVATAVILFLFFRSLTAVVFPMIIIGTVVVWCVGFLSLFGYKITILTGLLPPILVVIGIPNCVYLLNKYHQEFRKHGNKVRALSKIIRKIGLVALMTNTTTAIGFAVFMFMDIQNLRQFGVVSSLSIMSTFVVSLILLPAFFSYLPPPSHRELQHLDRKPLNRLLLFFDRSVFQHRKIVYLVVVIIALVSLGGFYQMRSLSFMLDNLPENSKPKRDMQFFEENFGGVMPLEVVVDTKRKKGVMNLATLKKIERFEQSLEEVSIISAPISMISFLKASTQAFYNNEPSFYTLPGNRDRVFVLNYLQKSDNADSQGLMESLIDSTGQKMRISLKVADVGSQKLDSVVNEVVQPRIDKAFPNDKITAKITGTTLIFLKGNDNLIRSLRSSLLLAIALISILMAVLFGSVRMILISIATNILPLLITAGMMGYLGVPLKPSTALIFSIAFGIAIDDSIHFLARYRQELIAHNYSVPHAIRISLRETGTSMVYTSIILFFGFIVFVSSDFDGTIALGGLTSATLLCAMFANLILLPSLLLTFDPGDYKPSPLTLASYYDEDSIFEEDDEEIDISQIKVGKKNL